MRIVFFGTGKFGIPTLKALVSSKYGVAAAVTRPDVRQGRGWNVTPTPVKDIVEKTVPGLTVLQPEKLSDNGVVENLKSLNADIFVVVDYGRILTKEVLAIPSKCCINLHPSLLPLYRGAAPVNRAIINGDKVTGNTVIRMNERMDAGDIMIQDQMELGEYDTAETVETKLSARGASLVLKAVDMLADGRADFIPQDETKATYAPKLEKSEGKVDWNTSAQKIALKVRGMEPWPGAYTYMGGKVLKILQAAVCEVPDGDLRPGEAVVSGSKLIVVAGEGALRIGRLQLEGKKAMTSDEFLLGHRDIAGKIFE